MVDDRPSGTIAFLFTDIEGSTRAWEESVATMSAAVARHDVLLRSVFGAHGGYVFKAMGDAFCVAFHTVGDAVAAAAAAQAALAVEPWEDVRIPVRMGVHAGNAVERDGDYFGPTLNRTARLMAAGHGGQTLLSLAAHELVVDNLPAEIATVDLGEHRLKDLTRPEHVFQLRVPGLPDTFPALRTLDQTPNNLPLQATSLIGREAELAEVTRWLGRSRLVTLLGPAGTGKTRLALQLAADSLDAFPDGAYFVDLSSATDAAHVEAMAARALGLREEVGRPIRQTILDHLAARRTLLVLDNCEQVVEPAADLASAIVRAAPDVRVVATSRELLRVPGEQVYAVPPLRLPERNVVRDPASLSAFEAVRLFVERATAAQPTFGVTNANAPAVAELCIRLDGIPLAIELAAVRVRMMTPEQILERLGDRFRLLTGGSRTAQARQQTLEGAIAWSYDLLGEDERTVLDRLSVFLGGWTLEAAERVVAGEDGGRIATYEVLDLLASLVDKSLVAVDDRERTSRYRLLESVRAFATRRLAAADGATAVRTRRDAWFLELAAAAHRHEAGPEAPGWFAQLDADMDNLTATFEDAVAAGNVHLAVQLCIEQWWTWYARGYLSEGRAWMARALAMPGADADTVDAAKMHHGMGVLANTQADYGAARQHLEHAEAISASLGDDVMRVRVLTDLGIATWGQRDLDQAESYIAASAALFRERGDMGNYASATNNLGLVAESRGDYRRANAFYREALALRRSGGVVMRISTALINVAGMSRRLGDLEEAGALLDEALAIQRGLHEPLAMAFIRHAFGTLEADRGDAAGAAAHFDVALATAEEVGDRGLELQCVEGMARVAELRGDHRRSLVLLAAADGLRERCGVPRSPNEQPEIDDALARARGAMASGEAAAAWAEGWAMDPASAFALARDGAKSGGPATAADGGPDDG